MPWIVEYNHELGMVQGTYVGRVTADEFEEATIKAIDLAQDNNTNLFLIDDSKCKGGASMTGLFGLPTLHEKLKADPCTKAALILPSSGTAAVRDARFYETVCLSRGWQVKETPSRRAIIRASITWIDYGSKYLIKKSRNQRY